MTLRNAPQPPRWITPVFTGLAANSQTFTTGTVYLTQFSVTLPCRVDGLVFVVGAATSGNVTGGVLGPVSRTADAATGAPVAAQSASTAMGPINTPQLLTWTPVLLLPGVYYAALEADNATGTFMRLTNQRQGPGFSGTYARSGGYGPLVDPTPTWNETGTAIPGVQLRVAA